MSVQVIIQFRPGDQLVYQLEHGPHGMVVHSPEPGVVHVDHVRMPAAMTETQPTALGGVRLRVVGDEPTDRTMPRGGKFS